MLGKKGVRHMSDTAKQILTVMNQPLHERLQREFIYYLNTIEQRNLENIAKKINWESAIRSLDNEYKKLWNNLAIPKAAKELGLKDEFKREIIVSIKIGLFHSLYIILKDKTKESNVNEGELIKSIDEYFRFNMHDYFRVFDYQLTITLLHKISDPHLISKKIEDLRKRFQFTSNMSAINNSIDNEKVFIIIDKELERRERIGQRWSIKAACEYYARNELGIEPGPGQQFELDNFHKKYLEHRKKNGLDN
jgi:hypothetical protein